MLSLFRKEIKKYMFGDLSNAIKFPRNEIKISENLNLYPMSKQLVHGTISIDRYPITKKNLLRETKKK